MLAQKIYNSFKDVTLKKNGFALDTRVLSDIFNATQVKYNQAPSQCYTANGMKFQPLPRYRFEVPYEPFPHFDFVANHSAKHQINVFHRRCGKTYYGVAEILEGGLLVPFRNPILAFMAPDKVQAKRNSWEYFKDFVKGFPPEYVSVSESNLTVDIQRPWVKQVVAGRVLYGDKVRIYLLGSEKGDSVRGLYLDGAILDEFAFSPEESYKNAIYSALTDRGGWVRFNSSINGINHYKQKYDEYRERALKGDFNYRAFNLNAYQTNVFGPQKLREICLEIGEEAFKREFLNVWTAGIVGRPFAKKMTEAMESGRVTHVPYDPRYPVETTWDIGQNNLTVVLFRQFIQDRYHYIDMIATSDMDVKVVIKEIISKPYVYSFHKVPHDSRQRDKFSARSWLDQAVEAFGQGKGMIDVNKRVKDIKTKVQAGIDLIERSVFDKENCFPLVNGLTMYRFQYDKMLQTFSMRPVRGDECDIGDAFMEGASHTAPSDFGGASKNKLSNLQIFNYNKSNPFGGY